MLDALIEFDHYLFLLINKIWVFKMGDIVFPWVRQAQHWYLFYIILLVFAYFVFKKKFFYWLVFLAGTIAFTDQLSSSLFKPLFGRLRPCADPQFLSQIRLLVPCPSLSYSFTSSHAFNHFAAAIFFFRSFKPYMKNFSYVFFLWAALICYGQIYVGVHFPFDIIVGAILGLIFGNIIYNFFLQKSFYKNISKS
ncbi:MAG: phosphatase PAP2 family protein [Sediminibacterium sp.]|nr:phosphatase PAP2 family protein [Sediminibacterium sp.]